MDAIDAFNLRIPGDIGCIGSAIDDVTRFLKSSALNINEDSLFEIKVVLNELIINAIKHGSKNEVNKCVKITAGLTRNKQYMYTIIEDEGEGYNCSCKRTAPKPVELDDIFSLKENGRGILIVNSLCDCVKYNEKGNKVVILKKLSLQ